MSPCYSRTMRNRVMLASLCLSFGCGGSTTDEQVTPADTGVSESAAADSAPVLDSASEAAPSDTGSLPSDALSDAPADVDSGLACTALTLGPAVTVMAVAEEGKVLTGGTIADGTYVLTSATDYTGAGGATGSRGTLQRTVRYNAGKFEFIRKDMGAAVEVGSGSFAIKDGRYDQHLTCPTDRSAFGAMFEADATTLKMYIGGDGTNPRLVVMTKM